MREEKKKYLNLYLLQQAKIQRLNLMCQNEPQKSKSYKQEIYEAMALRTEIENKITAINEPLLTELMFLKYIFGNTLEEIAIKLNYSKRHIERLHIKALDKFKM